MEGSDGVETQADEGSKYCKWGGGGRNITSRLDAAALERRVRGLASGGDG